MAAEPAHDPSIAQEEEQEIDEGDESDVYEVEGEELEGDAYAPEEDEEDEEDEEAGEVEPENMTALLLSKQNGTKTEVYEEEEEDEDEEYLDNGDGATGNSQASSVVAGSKRGVDELSEGDAYGDEEEEEEEAEVEGEKLSKKARV